MEEAPGRRRRWSPSPAGAGIVAGILAFWLALFVPAVIVASHSAKRPAQGPPPSPGRERLIKYVRRHWTEEAGRSRAVGIGLATGVATATAGQALRARRR